MPYELVYNISYSWADTLIFYMLLFGFVYWPDAISRWMRQRKKHQILWKSWKKRDEDHGND
jgi:hypothetical protein